MSCPIWQSSKELSLFVPCIFCRDGDNEEVGKREGSYFSIIIYAFRLTFSHKHEMKEVEYKCNVSGLWARGVLISLFIYYWIMRDQLILTPPTSKLLEQLPYAPCDAHLVGTKRMHLPSQTIISKGVWLLPGATCCFWPSWFNTQNFLQPLWNLLDWLN